MSRRGHGHLRGRGGGGFITHDTDTTVFLARIIILVQHGTYYWRFVGVISSRRGFLSRRFILRLLIGRC